MKNLIFCVFAFFSVNALALEGVNAPEIGNTESLKPVESDAESKKVLDSEITEGTKNIFEAMKNARLLKLQEMAAKSEAEIAKARQETKMANKGELIYPNGSPGMPVMPPQQFVPTNEQKVPSEVKEELPKPKKVFKPEVQNFNVVMISGESAKIQVGTTICDVVVGSACGGLTVTTIDGEFVRAKNSTGKMIVGIVSDSSSYPVNDIAPVVKADQKQAQRK